MTITNNWSKTLIKTPYLFISSTPLYGKTKLHTILPTLEIRGKEHAGTDRVWNQVANQLSSVINDATRQNYEQFFKKKGTITISRTEVVVEYGSKNNRQTIEVVQPAEKSSIYNFARVYLPETVSLLFKPDDPLEEEDNLISHQVPWLFEKLFHESDRNGSKIILQAIETI